MNQQNVLTPTNVEFGEPITIVRRYRPFDEPLEGRYTDENHDLHYKLVVHFKASVDDPEEDRTSEYAAIGPHEFFTWEIFTPIAKQYSRAFRDRTAFDPLYSDWTLMFWDESDSRPIHIRWNRTMSPITIGTLVDKLHIKPMVRRINYATLEVTYEVFVTRPYRSDLMDARHAELRKWNPR